jgi:hypothetical protein
VISRSTTKEKTGITAVLIVLAAIHNLVMKEKLPAGLGFRCQEKGCMASD